MKNLTQSNKAKFAIFSIFLFALIGCGFLFLNNNHFWKALISKMNEGRNTVMFSDITDFAWDTVCVLEPYSLGVDQGPNYNERIKTYIKGDLGKFKDELPSLNDDSKWAFVFINSGKVVKIEKRGRGFYLYKGYEDNCLSKDTASFNKKDNNKLTIQ